MEPLIFSVAVVPRGKGRPRATVRKGANHATVYTDDATRAYEAKLRKVAEKVMDGREPFTGSLAVTLRFRIPVPVSYSRKRRDAILTGAEVYAGSSDLDNYCKACLDAFNRVVFVDDKQVAQLFLIRKPAERPGIDVRVEPFGMSELAG